MSQINRLKDEVDKMRQALYKILSEEESLTSNRVLNISQSLDSLLNKYDELINNEQGMNKCI